MYNDDLNEEAHNLFDLNAVMQSFGVHEWMNLGVLDHRQNELLQVLVEIQEQRYVLTERPSGLAEQENDHTYAFGRHLARSDIPVTAFWLTPDGAPCVTVEEETFELRQYREGEFFDSHSHYEQARLVAAGEMLGRIHQSSCLYAGPRCRWPSEVQAGGLTQGWLNFARGQIEQYEAPAVTAALSRLVNAWERVLPSAMMAIGTGRDLPEFHIHGDYSALNLRFSSRQVSEVFGLEASRWEKRLIELAYGVFYFSALEWGSESNVTRPLVKRGLDPTRVRLFLQGYGSIYPPAPGEAILLVDALALIAPIITANGPLEDIFYTPESLDEMSIEDALERLAWATALPDWLMRVRHAFAEMW